MAHKILFADDSQMINEVMKFAFENDEFIADIAQSEQKILEKINQNNYDLLIISSELNGIEIAKKVKEKYKNKEIFIISKNNETNIKKLAKQNGVTGWIVKPLIPEKFVKTLRYYLNKNKIQNNKI
jgi:two-component system chemotaxis response regulator CheY